MEKQILMYGCTIEELEKSKPKYTDELMYSAMILSDAQEEIARGNVEFARQFINRAKHFIFKYREENGNK
jgi:hypothetical protein